MTTAWRTKSILHVATAIALLASVAVLAWAAFAPMSMPSSDAESNGGATTAASRPAQTPPLATFATAWSRDLRQPLDDAPRSAPAAAQAATSSLSVRLVGTIVDPVRPRGIFMTQLGQMELRGVGDKAGGAEILKIDERSATVSVSGQPVVIKLEKIEFAVPGAAPSARVSDKPAAP